MTAGIYAITHTASGRMYVGSAVNAARRWSQHKSALSRSRHDNPILQAGWSKHGAEAYTFSVLEEVADVANLITREQHFFDTLDPFYNILRVAGSNLGHKHSAETRARLAAAAMGNTRNLGRTQTHEARAAVSRALTGRVPSDACMAAARAASTGRVNSPAHRTAISNAQTGRRHSPATLALMAASAKARPPFSAATRAKISAAAKVREAAARAKREAA